LRRIREEGPKCRLVAFVMDEKAIPRRGMPIATGADSTAGEVTSGTHSPMLDKGIGMGYVPAAAATPGSELRIDVRGRVRRATVVPKPIYKPEEAA
jgi:aminomethyltransferase